MTLTGPLVPAGYQPQLALPMFTPGQPAGLNQFALNPGAILSAGNPNMSAANGGIPFRGASMAGRAAERAAAAQQAGIGSMLSQNARSATPGAGTAASRAMGGGGAMAARAGSGILPEAAAAGGIGGRLAGIRAGLPGQLRGLMKPGNLARGVGWGLAGAFGGAAGQGIAGALGAGDETAADVGRLINYGVLGAGLGSMVPVIGTGLGAGIGAGIGALGFIPGIEDAPIIGGLWGGSKGPSSTETLESIRGNMNDVLTSMGANQDFINRANRQLTIALQVNNPDPEKENFGAYNTEQLRQVGTQILEGMIQQFGMEQQNAQQQSATGSSFDSALAEIMAAQAWMQPLLQNQLATAQTYADQYAASARAAAASLGDPALAAAGTALANQFSADQASSNQLALQQLMYQPQMWQQQLEQQYNEQMLALQQQSLQLQQQQMAAGGQLGLAPGLYPMS